jgi:hypothetical protein
MIVRERRQVEELDYVYTEDPVMLRGGTVGRIAEYIWQPAPAEPSRRRTALRKRVTFLRELAQSGSVTYAAIRAGLERRTLYRWRDRDERFRVRWDAILERRGEVLFDHAYTLARNGTPHYFSHRGAPVGGYRRPDPKLIMFLLRRMQAKPSSEKTAGSGAESGDKAAAHPAGQMSQPV